MKLRLENGNFKIVETLNPDESYSYNKLPKGLLPCDFLGCVVERAELSAVTTIMSAGEVEDTPLFVLSSSDGFQLFYNPLTGEVTTAADGSGGSGGGSSYSVSDVNLYDYDGSIIASYTTDEFLALTALPDIPAHDGLVAQGWTCTLEEAKASVQKNGKLNAGVKYASASGATELNVKLLDDILNMTLSIAVDGSVTIDWGDGSVTSTATGTSLETLVATQHTYSAAGEYTISITVDSGEIAIFGSDDEASEVIVGRTSERNVASLKSLALGRGITSIGDNAFRGCYSLTSVVIPDSVTYIGERAFNYCPSLTSVVIPDSVTYIGERAFSECYSLTSVVIPDSVTSIGDNAFSDCYSLTSVVIPDSNSIISIGDSAFTSCNSLTSVVIPNSVTYIGNGTFGGCLSLTSVVIPDSVTYIGENAFSECYSLTSVVIPDSVTSIGDNAFSNCYSLPENFPN